VVTTAGVVTTALHEMEVGTVMGVRGPLGNSWPIDYLAGKNVVIVGGGFAFTTIPGDTRFIIDHLGIMQQETRRWDFVYSIILP